MNEWRGEGCGRRGRGVVGGGKVFGGASCLDFVLSCINFLMVNSSSTVIYDIL